MPNNIFHIDSNSAVPMYRQIIDSVYNSIETGLLKKGDKLPSVNKICIEFELSRDTVIVAFNNLKSSGILSSVNGKGYYITSTEIQVKNKIFLLFDELNAFKEDLYSSFIRNLNPSIVVDTYFHHFNYKFFKKLIAENKGKYASYVIMPATFDNSRKIISILPKDKVYILDQFKPDLSDFPVIYQDFEADVYEKMLDARDLLSKYKKLIMIFPGGKEPIGRTTGFTKFCTEFNIPFEIISSVTTRKVQKGEAYFIISDRNLVKVIKKALNSKLKIGVDIGIVAFNDAPLKELGGGITTISTDFKFMGRIMAEMVQNNDKKQLRNPSNLIRRKSL